MFDRWYPARGKAVGMKEAHYPQLTRRREARGLLSVTVASLLLAVALVATPSMALGDERPGEGVPNQAVVEGADDMGGQQGLAADGADYVGNEPGASGETGDECGGSGDGAAGSEFGNDLTGNDAGNDATGDEAGNDLIGDEADDDTTGDESGETGDGATGDDSGNATGDESGETGDESGGDATGDATGDQGSGGVDDPADDQGDADKTNGPARGNEAPAGDEFDDRSDDAAQPETKDEATTGEQEAGPATTEPATTEPTKADPTADEKSADEKSADEKAAGEKAADKAEVSRQEAGATEEAAAPEAETAKAETVLGTQSANDAAPAAEATTTAKAATAKAATAKTATAQKTARQAATTREAPAKEAAATAAAAATAPATASKEAAATAAAATAPKKAAVPTKAPAAKAPATTAKTAAKKYFWVRFYDAFGNVAKKQKVASGKKATAPKLAATAGRAFKGWDVKFNKVIKHLYVHPLYKDKSKTYAFGWNTEGADSGVFTWCWRKAGKKLSLNRFNYISGDIFGNGAPSGMELIGWNTKPDGSGKAYGPEDVIKTPARDLVFYAQYKKATPMVEVKLKANFRNQYDTTFRVAKGGNIFGSYGISYEDGYVLVGYSTKANGKGKFYSLQKVAKLKPRKSLTLYKVWKKADAPLKFVDNHAKGKGRTYYVKSGGSYRVLNYPSEGREGYQLVGWNTKKNGKGTSYRIYADKNLTKVDPAFVKVPKKGMTLYAQYQKIGDGKQYTVTYNSNYGKGSKSTDTHFSGTDFYVWGSFDREGYTLVGFNTKKNGKGTTYYRREQVTMPAKNLTLYAQWRQNKVKAVFNPNYSGKDVLTGKKAAKVAVKIPAGSLSDAGASYVRGRRGWRLIGWNTKKDGTGASYRNGVPLALSKSTNLYAQWQKLTAIAYNPNYKGKGVETEKSYYRPGCDSSIYYPPHRDGYTFVGWNTKKNGKGKSYKKYDTIAVTKKNLTLYAQWRKNTATLKLVDNYKGGGTKTSKVAPGIALGESDGYYYNNPYRDGYTLVGWNTKKNGKGATYNRSGLDGLKPTKKGITLYGVWAKAPTVTYKANNGTSTKSSSSSFSAYLNTHYFTKKGKAMAGWNTKANGKGVSFAIGDAVYNIPSSKTFYAQWKKPTAKITYKWVTDAGTTKTKTAGVMGGAYNGYELTEPADRKKVYFVGWNTKKNGKGEYLSESSSERFIPKGGMTVWANWKKKPTLTYDANYAGSTATKVTYVRPYKSADLAGNTLFKRDDYYIGSWNTKRDGSGDSYALPYAYRYMEDSNTTLYAQWVPKTRLTLDYNGGTNGSAGTELVKKGIPNSDPYYYDVSLSPYSGKAKRAGYTLKGWDVENSSEYPYYSKDYSYSWYDSSSETLYAIWAKDHKVTLNANGGTGGTSFTLTCDNIYAYLNEKATPTRDGYTFDGWSTSKTATSGDTSYLHYNDLSSDVTYYAVWIKNE